jgi:hypothetical protein
MTHQKLNKHLIKIITEYLGDNNNIEFDIEMSNFNLLGNDQIIQLVLNENIPESFYFKHERKFQLYIDYFIKKKNFPIKFIKKHMIKHLHFNKILYYNSNAPYLFLDEYVDTFSDHQWQGIIRNNEVIPEWWYEKHINKFNDITWQCLVNSKVIQFWWYEKHIFKLKQFLCNLENLFSRSDITESFIEKCLIIYGSIYWNNILEYSNLQYSFYLKHKSKIPLYLWNSKVIIKKYNIIGMNKLLNQYLMETN